LGCGVSLHRVIGVATPGIVNAVLAPLHGKAADQMRRISRRLPVVDRALRRRRFPAKWFDDFYASTHDPFGFDTEPYEQAKYLHTLEVIGPGPFRAAWEIGCSVGTFTRLLAPACEDLLATDIAGAAVERTRERCRELPQVRAEQAVLPDDVPSGPFDLVVASDVLYYLPEPVLRATVRRIAQQVAAGGTLVALHYLGDFGAPTSGERVHEVLEESLAGWTRTASDHRAGVGPRGSGYRIDRWDRPAA
jgi:predicted TPR repeat methyltransferase